MSRLLSPPVALLLTATMSLVDAPGVSAATISKKAKESFIASLASPAQQAQRSYGVPASVSMAQAIVNSDWGNSAAAEKGRNYFGVQCATKMTADQFASLADEQVGKPYVLGAEASTSDPNPPRFDCSELVEWLYGRSGNRITDLAAWQYDATRKVTGSPRTGDLVFLRNNPARSNGIGHVAVVTEKLDGGDWRIVEARGRAHGVVHTTLSYWKTRNYYAGLRRSASFSVVGKSSPAASAARPFQNGCVTVGKVSYAKYSSVGDAFAAHAAAVAKDSRYADARKSLGNAGAFVKAIAKVEQPKNASAYASKLRAVIAEYNLGFYDNVAFDLVLFPGKSGPKVTALQYLLSAAGYAVPTTGKYDSTTAAAVRKYQRSKRLEVDGEAGPRTLTALSPSLSKGAKGDAVRGLTTLLASAGQQVAATSSFGADLVAAVKSFQASVSLSVTGTVDDRTWAALFMTLDGGTPTVSGKAAVGQKLTAAAGQWGPGDVRLSYQWYRGGAAIGGATGSTRTVKVEDAGQALSVRVTGTRPLYTPTVRRSSATATVPLLKLKAAGTPTVSGKAKVGSTMTAKPGAWAPAPVSFRYQWYRGTTPIANATKPSYTVTAADGGRALSVAVTGTKTGHAAVTRKSVTTATVPRQVSGPAPTIAGAARVGSTLTARSGAWSPAKVALSYQWFRNNSAIKGATRSSYTPAVSDLNVKLTVRVTGNHGGYDSLTRVSTSVTVAKGKLTAKTPVVAGTRKAGKTLKVRAGSWGPGGVALSYQWYRGSARVKGATKTSYKLTSKDRGKKVTVVVRGTRAGYETVEKKATVSIAK